MTHEDYLQAPTPELTPVVSSTIAAIGWLEMEPRVGTLTVQFKSGATYVYAPVPVQVYQLLMLPGQSVGGTFHDLVKRGPYVFRPILRKGA